MSHPRARNPGRCPDVKDLRLGVIIHRKTRFQIWAFLVALLLVGQPVWIVFAQKPILLWSGMAIFCGALTAFAALLVTTPPDAIRLHVRQSGWIILAGALWLLGVSLWIIGPGDGFGASIWTICVLSLTILCLWLLRRSDKSLWWATLFAWNPLTLLVPMLFPAA